MIQQILAIDPGVTTGYAIVDMQGNLIESGNLLDEDLLIGDTVLENYSGLTRFVKPVTLVVIEEIPTFANSKLGRDLRQVIDYLTRLFPHAVWIRPTDWKSIGPISNYPIPKRVDMSTHQKDAFRIGIYYLTRKGVTNGKNSE